MSVRRHTAYNLLGALLPTAVGLLTIPTYIRVVGEARYGVLAIVWAFLGYFGVFDLGLGRATAQRIAALGGSPVRLVASTFWTALLINGALGVIGAFVIWPVSNYYFGYKMSIDADLRSELCSALPWLVFAAPLITLSGVVGGALQGRAQFLELNIISVAGAVSFQILPLLVAWRHGPDLAWLVPSVILTRLFWFGVTFWRCKVHVFKAHAPSITLHDAKSLLLFGGWVTITSLVGPLMTTLDRFIIGAMVGARGVTYYTVPFQLAQRSTVLPAALTSALFPRFAQAGSIERGELAVLAIRSLAVAMTPVMVIALSLVDPFFRLWISSEFASKASVTAMILLLGFWINGLAFVPFAQLQAAGRPDMVAKLHTVELIPYLALLYVGMSFWGLAGAAAAFSLRVFGDCVLLLWLAGTLPNGVAILKVPAMLLLVAFGAALGLSIGSSMWWLAAVTLLTAALWWSWRHAPADMRKLALGGIKKMLVDVPGEAR